MSRRRRIGSSIGGQLDVPGERGHDGPARAVGARRASGQALQHACPAARCRRARHRAGVHFGAGLHLDEGHLLVPHEHGRHPEDGSSLLDELGARARVGEETLADAPELRPQRVAGDEPGVALGHEDAGGVPGGVVRTVAGRPEERRSPGPPRPDG